MSGNSFPYWSCITLACTGVNIILLEFFYPLSIYITKLLIRKNCELNSQLIDYISLLSTLRALCLLLVRVMPQNSNDAELR